MNQLKTTTSINLLKIMTTAINLLKETITTTMEKVTGEITMTMDHLKGMTTASTNLLKIPKTIESQHPASAMYVLSGWALVNIVAPRSTLFIFS
ncbi:uncharacterized protein LOC119979521 isoform X25 [Scyliorhinus canicula]|nr:uncharacterized protein LOC119979521 isoform X23 [Scyliorhinus canicula]XP_038677808.1 uncharacterized protein LOC119979521 isoform X23 [Scyliorhinus canicula]XP_038677810.1 uncharacterized protein LOC119979521 isoform X23 [Scyliorhinus canicula]XP_038677811.1 uncharacterized protein LOC119979521 isoform X25 [Scyliorhinus canicula]XP_038677812.1 uncharacterized protein LOC119979521 isoform X25 [Scyliorhinus canicula]